MNWIKENKFLSGVIAVVVVGGGVLGYLLFAAMGKYDEASNAFDQQAGELHRLQGLPIYPNAKNLKTLEDQRGEYQTHVEELQKSLRSMELPVEPMTPEKFQDVLKASVTAYLEKANAVHMKVPERFFLGYEQYQAVPPRPEAAPLLGRELKAIEWVLGRLVEHNVLELVAVKPEEIPEEKEGQASSSRQQRNGPQGGGPGGMPGPGGGMRGLNGPGGPGGRGSRRGAAGADSVRKSAFTVSFVCEEGAFQGVLNDIVTAKSQYYIVRSFETKSTSDKPPMRETAGSSGAAGIPQAPPPEAPPAPAVPPPAGGEPAPATGAPAAAPAAPEAIKLGEVTKFIVGEEKIQVVLLIEIVTFPEEK